MLIQWQLDHLCIWRFFVIKFEIRRSWAITARTITRICRSWGLWLKSRCSWRKQWFFTHLSRLHNQSSKSFASSTPSRVTFYFLHSFFWYYRNWSHILVLFKYLIQASTTSFDTGIDRGFNNTGVSRVDGFHFSKMFLLFYF